MKKKEGNNEKEEMAKERNSVSPNIGPKFNNMNPDGEAIEDKNENDKPIVVEDKSNINLDITKKFATMMDFSVILNKKQNADETNMEFGLNKTGLGGMEKENWDISCIGKG